MFIYNLSNFDDNYKIRCLYNTFDLSEFKLITEKEAIYFKFEENINQIQHLSDNISISHYLKWNDEFNYDIAIIQSTVPLEYIKLITDKVKFICYNKIVFPNTSLKDKEFNELSCFCNKKIPGKLTEPINIYCFFYNYLLFLQQTNQITKEQYDVFMSISFPLEFPQFCANVEFGPVVNPFGDTIIIGPKYLTNVHLQRCSVEVSQEFIAFMKYHIPFNLEKNIDTDQLKMKSKFSY